MDSNETFLWALGMFLIFILLFVAFLSPTNSQRAVKQCVAVGGVPMINDRGDLTECKVVK